MKKGSLQIRPATAGILALFASTSVYAGGPAMSGLVAEADTAESVFSSPAGMARLKGTHVTLQGQLANSLGTFEVDESKSSVDGGDPDNESTPIIIPAAYYVRQLNDRWHVGASLTAPAGFGSDYGGTWSGRYYTDDYSLVYVAITPAVSYRINDRFSVGVSAGINYTATNGTAKVAIPYSDDGKMTFALDGIGVNVTLSALYEFTTQTRAGIAYTSKSEADLEGKVKLRNLPTELEEVLGPLGLTNVDTEITNTLPQRVVAGMYHEFESGISFTVDGLWMQFSDFGTTDVSFNGDSVNVESPDIYDDIWATTVGASFPYDDRLTYKLGAMYLSPAVSDEDRTLSMRIDRIWGVGAGLTYTFDAEHKVDVNLTVLETGEASVDTGESPLRGRLVGKSENPYTLLFEMSYHF